MLYFLTGTVALIEPGLAVLDCGGVGYACKTTNYTLGSIQKGKAATLYTHLSVREDGVELYGFGTKEEKRLFLLLISVSGVGPKAALSILSTAPPAQLGAVHYHRGPEDADHGAGNREENCPAYCTGAAGQAGEGAGGCGGESGQAPRPLSRTC